MAQARESVIGAFEIRFGEVPIDLRERIERGTACPHGRPTSLTLTRRDLDRQFRRT